MLFSNRSAGRTFFRRVALVLVILGVLTADRTLADTLSVAGFPNAWNIFGRAREKTTPDSVLIAGGYAVSDQSWSRAEFSFRARTPEGSDQVQIWGGFRCRDRDTRYVFALRGGDDNDLYLARYAPDGGAKFLGFAPLDFHPVPGTWYKLRVKFFGRRIQIYLDDETVPRINVSDNRAAWDSGGVVLGGGWLWTEFSDVKVRPLTDADVKSLQAMGNIQWSPPATDKEQLRQRQRSAYQPAIFPALGEARTQAVLSGRWLFEPDYELPPGDLPVKLDYDDAGWNVMPVPSFWTPGLSWLHGETNFTDINEFSATKGVADSLAVQEIKRCDAYTFDWRKTHGAWYRQYVDLPADLDGRNFELSFDAIAKVSEVWVNGVRVGSHTGMFGPVNCDVTKAIRPGRNVIAVHVESGQAVQPQPDKVEGVAVSVAVTSSMLHSLPHGMFQEDVAGIWQPVRLTATAPVHVTDCFVVPGLQSADLNLAILNAGDTSSSTEVGYAITSIADGSVLYSNAFAGRVAIAPGQTSHLKLSTPIVHPKLWSPQDPNLYCLAVFLRRGNEDIDHFNVTFGFRTFCTDGDQLLLNGKPFRIRGANPFPNTLRPNDAALAHKFMEMARAGNVEMTRSHIVPFTSTWLDAADRTGMAVSFEGTWPWLMLEGDPPDDQLIQTWRSEFISLIHEYRNHPSILLWTVNNEMKFEWADQDNPRRLQQKWRILNDTIRAMRQADPSRPIVADSSYVRKAAEKGFQEIVAPEGLDDGDIDDAHHYYGWYDKSFFHFYHGEYDSQLTPGRPLISQEMSTGYPNNDDGHPVRFYLFKHYTPQALVGDDAYENANPAIFLNRQAFMTKELAETLRRTGHDGEAGNLFFSYVTWFHQPWSVTQIRPWPTYYALKTALQPVLVSAELYGRHFYAGTKIHCRLCLVNDSTDCLPTLPGRVKWDIQSGGNILAGGSVDVPAVNYCQNHWQNIEFDLPANLPASRTDARLELRLEAAGKLISQNQYDILVASDQWAEDAPGHLPLIQLWDPGRSGLKSLFALPVTTVISPAEASLTNVLVIGDLRGSPLTAADRGELRQYVSRGGRVLMVHPGSELPKLYPSQVDDYTSKEGEIVTMHVPESPVFSGIEPLDLAWFQRGPGQVPLACNGVFEIARPGSGVLGLAWQCDLHGYLNRPSEVTGFSGYPLVEIHSGQGVVLASELNFESSPNDPVARRVLMNSLNYLARTNLPHF